MKIRPGMNFFNEKPQYFGSPPVIHFLLGTRFDESTARKATMDAHTRMDSDLHAHGTIPSASTYGRLRTGPPMMFGRTS